MLEPFEKGTRKSWTKESNTGDIYITNTTMLAIQIVRQICEQGNSFNNMKATKRRERGDGEKIRTTAVRAHGKHQSN